jgi:uncharacterized protein (TIGR03118 family)
MKRTFELATLLLSMACVAAARGAGENAYVQTNLVANNDEYGAQIIDPNLVNGWGIALRPPGAGGHIWISNDRTGTSSEYIGDVNGIPLHQDGLQIVPLEAPAFTDKGYASVTGQVYNAASDLANQAPEFLVSGPAQNDSTHPPTPLGTVSGSAKFVFVTKDGAINAWLANTATAMLQAPVVVDYSKTGHSPYAANPVYTGVAMTTHAVTSADPTLGNRLYASDFRNGVIEVFNNQWKDITQDTGPGTVHFATPASVGDLHPFNIQDIGGHLFVAYAMFDPNSDEGFEDAVGYGHLVEYNEDGSLVMDFKSGSPNAASNEDDPGNGVLNSPWGMAIAPAGWGAFGGDLLVANFGDNSIAAFDPGTGNFVDFLRDTSGDPISIDGIWGLTFGNGVSLGDANALYFTAGPDTEQDGLFGRLTVAPEPGTLFLLGIAMPLLSRRRRPASRA